MSIYIREMWKELSGGVEIKIVGKTDIRTLEKSIHSNTGVSNRKMRIDITRIKEIINTKEVEEIQWMDGLTKEGGRVELLRRYVGGHGRDGLIL